VHSPLPSKYCPEPPHRTPSKLPARLQRNNSRHGRTLADIGNSHSEELLEVPEGVKVTIKTRNVVVEGKWTCAHLEGTFMANFPQVPA
jgi:hypothetical protein